MKKIRFLKKRHLLYFILLGFLGQVKAQQLICPPLFLENTESGTPFTTDWNKNLSSGTKYIPTVVHLIGDASTLTNNQVKSAIDQLNIDFIDPSGNHTVVFVLASISNKGQCSDGITRHPSITYYDQLYKSKTIWPNDKYYNIWVLSDPDVLGEVELKPSNFMVTNGILIRQDFIARQSPDLDGIDGLAINTSEIYPNNSGGHTLTHETGHWLNLLHVFSPCEGPGIPPNPSVWNCCYGVGEGTKQGDFIDDTPSQFYFVTSNTADCGNNISTCDNTSSVSQENFMSYGGPCINSFTNGQRDWMTHCLDNFRAYIWSDENLRCTGVVSEYNPVVTTGQNLIWNTSKTVIGSLIIESGATLTIPNGVIVQFCDLGKLIVKQGGRLNLYGTLTSSCTGRMWQGVEIWGTKSQSQLGQNYFQGQLWGYSSTVIEHAKTGVLLNNTTDQTGGSTGGVLICQGVSFLNNARAIQFEPYENKLPSSKVTSNRSTFTACLFETNNDYRGDNLDFYDPADLILFRSFADLKGVRGLVFKGCKFQNMRNNNELVTNLFYGYGIVATEAGFQVTDYCSASNPSPTFPPSPCASNYTVSSSFKNLFIGITAGDTEINGILPYSYQVTKTLFEGNWTGIRSTAGSRAIITQNTFKLGKLPPFVVAAEKITGLILDDTHKSFNVQENIFLRDPETSPDVAEFWDLTGIEAVSIGEYDNVIRKNYFTNLKTGNHSVGANATPLGDAGLRYLCNENSGNDEFDFDIANSSSINIIQANPTQPITPAGNLFSLTGPAGSNSDFQNRFDITYIYGSSVFEKPQFYDTDHFFPFLEDQPRSCESIFCDPPCRSESEITEIRQKIDRDVIRRDSLKSLPIVGSSYPASERLRDYITHQIHANAAEVSTHLAYTYGENSIYREVMAQTNSYDADLSLANDFLGSNETGNYYSIMNGMSAKYQLTDNALNEFNAYRAVTDMMATYYANGGNKYTLGGLQVDWLKDQADNSLYFRSRGMARRILRLYGYYYPVDYMDNNTERHSKRNNIPSSPELFSVYPNPANQQAQVHIETGRIESTLVRIKLFHTNGTLQDEKNSKITRSGDFSFATHSLAAGIYLVQVWLESGEIQTKRIVIIH